LIRTVRVISAICLFLCHGTPFAGEQSEAQLAFDNGKQAFRQGDYSIALEWFEKARAAGLDGPAVIFNIGVCQYRQHDYESALLTFRQVAEVESMAPLANYNLGLAAQKLGDVHLAKESFLLVLDTGDEKLQALALRQLEKYDAPVPLEPPSAAAEPWAAFVSLQGGHDTNVALLNQDLPAAGEAVDSAFTEMFASISGPYGAGSGFRADGSIYVSRFADASIYNQNSLRAGLLYHLAGDLFWADIGAHYGQASLDGDGYEDTWLASARVYFPLRRGRYAEVLLAHEQIDAGSSDFAYLEGDRQKLALRGGWRGEVHALRGEYTYEVNDRADPGVSPVRHRLGLRYVAQLAQAWSMELGATWRSSRFDQLPVTRDEDLVVLGMRVNWNFGQSWQAYAEYSVSDNESSDPTFAYDRNQGFIGVNWIH